MSRNILVIFAPKFLQFGIDIVNEYLSTHPDSKVYGFHTGNNAQQKKIENALGESLGKLWLLSEEEKKWLDMELSGDQLKKIDEEYGAGALGEVITSDRRIGRGLVSGGSCRPDPIGDLSVKRPSIVPAKYAAGLLKTAEEIVNQANPRVVFCYAVAGSPAIALALICRQKKIPFTRLTAARVGDRFIVDTDARGQLAPVREKYEQARKAPNLVETHIETAKALQKAFENAPVQPGYMIRNHQLIKSEKPWLGTLKVLAATVLNALKGRFDSATKLALSRAIYENRIQWARKFVREEIFSAVPEGQKYIYFPLHVDPEASTMVMSPHHTDQLSVVEALAKSAPAELVVVVKEHLPMVGRRPKGFYKRIKEMPRVVLANPGFDGIELVKNASLVSVITGTAAWEAIRLKVPTLVIGSSPYMCIENSATYEPCLSKLAKAIKEELKKPPATNEEMTLYIASLLSESFDLPSEMLWGNYSAQSADLRKETSSKIANWIEKRAAI